MRNPFLKKEYASERERRRARRWFMFRLRQLVIELVVLAVLVMAIVLPITLLNKQPSKEKKVDLSVSDVPKEEPQAVPKPVYPVYTDETAAIPATADAAYAILVDVTENRVVAAKGADVRTYPASVTKVMTLLVAVENITDFSDTFTMTYAITDPLYVQNATVAGFSNNEAVVLEDLLYGTILPSGADACQALAEYVAGTDAAFVEMMNARALELGLKNTHFTNTSGLHHPDHYTTAEDMAVILRAAMENEHCRQVLSTYQYTTAVTPQHPEGILLTSTLFSRMYGTEPDGATVIAGKTGYTTEAGHTVASFAEGMDGHEYILVTLKGTNKWEATYDAIELYTQFCPGTEKTETSTTSTAG